MPTLRYSPSGISSRGHDMGWMGWVGLYAAMAGVFELIMAGLIYEVKIRHSINEAGASITGLLFVVFATCAVLQVVGGACCALYVAIMVA